MHEYKNSAWTDERFKGTVKKHLGDSVKCTSDYLNEVTDSKNYILCM